MPEPSAYATAPCDHWVAGPNRGHAEKSHDESRVITLLRNELLRQLFGALNRQKDPGGSLESTS